MPESLNGRISLKEQKQKIREMRRRGMELGQHKMKHENKTEIGLSGSVGGYPV